MVSLLYPGNNLQTCGGPDRLSTYTFTPSQPAEAPEACGSLDDVSTDTLIALVKRRLGRDDY
jgi:hypothetical protein